VADKMDYVERDSVLLIQGRKIDLEFESKIEDVFGEQGIFSVLLKEHFGENGKAVTDLFDPSKIGTPMYYFKSEIMKEIGGMK